MLLIVLNKTNMPAILVECLFADSSDADKYDPKVIARAIVNGLVGIDDSSNSGWKLGWKNIDGEWYIFDDKGYALENAWYHIKVMDFGIIWRVVAR